MGGAADRGALNFERAIISGITKKKTALIAVFFCVDKVISHVMVAPTMKGVLRRFTPGNHALRVQRSRTGLGVFTEKPISKGACIIEYTGRPVSEKEQCENRGKYLFWTSKDTMIDGNIRTNTARFINHSCRPNGEIDIRNRRIYVFAKRNIKAGEELNYDYDTEYFDEHIKPKGCLCHKCSKK